MTRRKAGRDSRPRRRPATSSGDLSVEEHRLRRYHRLRRAKSGVRVRIRLKVRTTSPVGGAPASLAYARPNRDKAPVQFGWVTVRPLTSDDEELMERMMLYAGFPPDRVLPANARQMPHVRRFIAGWGGEGDVGVMAVDEQSRPLGAAWARVFHEPLLRDDTGAPVAEVAIAVEAHARGGGVGGALLDALADAARHAGHRQLSLSVSPRNPARRLYQRRGFEVVREEEHGLVMRRRLA